MLSDLFFSPLCLFSYSLPTRKAEKGEGQCHEYTSTIGSRRSDTVCIFAHTRRVTVGTCPFQIGALTGTSDALSLRHATAAGVIATFTATVLDHLERLVLNKGIKNVLFLVLFNNLSGWEIRRAASDRVGIVVGVLIHADIVDEELRRPIRVDILTKIRKPARLFGADQTFRVTTVKALECAIGTAQSRICKHTRIVGVTSVPSPSR